MDDVVAECRKYFNEPILSHLTVVRLVGYGETAVDCYYIVQPAQRERYWLSAVGGIISLRSLKGKGYVKTLDGEEWDDFRRLDNWLEINGAPKESEFILDVRPDDDEGRAERLKARRHLRS